MNNHNKKIKIVGTYRTGKTTLLNLFLGEIVFPVNDRHFLNELVHEVKYGDTKKIILHFNSLTAKSYENSVPEKVAAHIKKHNMKNIPPLEILYSEIEDYKGIKNIYQSHSTNIFEKAELFWPVPLLKKGAEFVDCQRLNIHTIESITNEDTVILVLNIQSVLSYDEMVFIKNLKNKGVKDLFFVVNGFDQTRKGEWHGAKAFVYNRLSEYEKNKIFFMSAYDAIKAKIDDNKKLLEDSGFPKLETALTEHLEKSAGKTSIFSNPSLNFGMKNSSDKNYFSWGNLNELTEIDSHLEFVVNLINKYKWEKSVQDKMITLLNQIIEKQQDEKLNLSVVGEFSTGKSTFINALLRTDLLVAGVLQGVTAASTIIEYGLNYKISLLYNNGNKREFTFSNLEQLREKLCGYTTKEELARDIKNVYVYLPSQLLKSGIRIIDTPGTNAITRWHEDVTVRTINEISDASVILTDINQPMPNTTVDFVKNHLSSVINQCIFVATKCDLIRRKEIESVISYIKLKATQELGIKTPKVFPYAAMDVLDNCTGEEADEDLLKLSYTTESNMMQCLAKQRSIIQTGKLLVLINEMYDAMTGQLDEIEKKRKQELELLNKFRQINLKSFVNEQKEKRKASFNRKVSVTRDNLAKQLENLKADAVSSVMKDLDSKNTLDSLDNFVKNGLTGSCEKASKIIIDKAKEAYTEINKLFSSEINVFQREFEMHFKNLNIMNISSIKNEINVSGSINVDSTTLSSASKYMSEQVSKDNKSVLGGVAGGAAIGTAILPGIGTVLGAIMGGFFGGMFSPDFSKARNSVKEKLKLPLSNYFDEVIIKCLDAVDAYIKKYTVQNGFISYELERYHTSYGMVVNRRITEEEKKRKDLEEKISTIENDKLLMENKKSRLKSVEEQLATAGGKDS